LVRATGLMPSTKSPHPSSIRAYSALNSPNPWNEKGAGERSSIPQRAAFGLPSAARWTLMTSKP
jgi:hypothetical protein